MEDTLDAVAVGIEEDILVKLHRFLLVAGKEIHLDALHAYALQPGHLAVAGDAVIHDVAWCLRRIVPGSVRVVPQHQRNALLPGILRKLLYAFTTYTLVPPVIHQTELVAHSSGEVDELHLIVIINAVILPDEPAPGVPSAGVESGECSV